MVSSKKDIHLKNLITWSFVASVVIGYCGYLVPSGGFQHLMWALAAFFMIIGASLLASKLSHADHDIPAAGFAIITVAQALSYGFVATNEAGTLQLGAVVGVFAPGLILISFYDLVPLLIRILGFAAAAAFATLAILIFLTENFPVNIMDALIGVGYMGLNLALLGWSWMVYKGKI